MQVDNREGAQGKVIRPTVYIVDSIGAHRGMHYYNFELTTALVEAGNINVTLVSTPETANHPLQPKLVKVRTGFRGIYGQKPRLWRGLAYGFSLARIGVWAFLQRPDLVHCHFYQIPRLDYFFLKWLDLLGIKTITTVHDVLPFELGNDFSAMRSGIHRRLYAMSSNLIVHSRYALESLGLLDEGLIPKAELIAHTGFPHVSKRYSIDPLEARRRLGFAFDIEIILVFGTIKPNKRLDLVIKALHQIVIQRPNIKLIIVGKPRNRTISADRELACHLGIENNIIWALDAVTDEEMGLYLSVADVVIFPYQWIYQSGAMLMAMSFGKAIIATAVGSNADNIRDGKSGILVPLECPEAIAEGIETLLDNPELSTAIGKAAKDQVTNPQFINDIALRTLELYRRSMSC